MATTIILALAAFCLASCSADVSVSEYIYWKKADIVAWNQYFPSRALEEERQTNVAAAEAVASLAQGLGDSLAGIVSFQAQELLTAELLMNDTAAAGCVAGIADYMTDAIEDEISTYDDCAADATSKLQRLNATWSKVKTTYLAAYKRALTGIDVCAKTYPNKDSYARLQSCVDSMTKSYFTAANTTFEALFPSPSMTYIQGTVIECASTAAEAVTAKGYQFLNMLVECAVLSGVVDPTTYKNELDQWKGYNDTLASQVSNAQSQNYYQVWDVEKEMQSYYDLQKQVLETYVIDSRGFSYYLTKIYGYLSDYYNTVTATSVDNPGDPSCTSTAKTTLDNITYLGATKSLSCDVEIVNNTKQLIADVNNHFTALNNIMPSIGNVAILNCFSQGYVFAPNTISDCFSLVYTGFDINYQENNAVIVQDVSTLMGYETFFSGVNLPCGNSSIKRVFLGADEALYDLQRCLYKTSGTTYSVTTPAAVTTTPAITNTTSATTPTAATTPATNSSATTTPATTTTSTSPPALNLHYGLYRN